MVSLFTGLKDEGLPALDFWEAISGLTFFSKCDKPGPCGNNQPAGPTKQLVIFEDNQATLQITVKGDSKKLRHLSRTHRVAMSWIKEVVDRPEVEIAYIKTDKQAADIFTKAFVNPIKFEIARGLKGVFPDNGVPWMPLIPKALPPVPLCCVVLPMAKRTGGPSYSSASGSKAAGSAATAAGAAGSLLPEASPSQWPALGSEQPGEIGRAHV